MKLLVNKRLTLLVVLFITSYINAQTVICPAETNLGTFDCNNINDVPNPVNSLQDAREIYGIEITGAVPGTGVTTRDTGIIFYCEQDAREITREVIIYNNANFNPIPINEEDIIATCVFTITTVADIEPPTFTVPPDTTIFCQLGAGVEFTGEPTDGFDNCANSFGAFDITFTDSPIVGSCAGDQTIERVWTLTDICGNISETQTQTITIQDITGPELTIPPDITVPCGTNPTDNSVTGNDSYAYDFCEDAEIETNSIIIPDLTQENTPCPGSTTYTKSWGALDNCGNPTQKRQIIVVECPPDCSNQDPCAGDILADPLPGECDCQVVEPQVLGCTDPSATNYNAEANCDDGNCYSVFDLALVKELTSNGPFISGTDAIITFTITIVNQGDITAQNIQIIDYVPAGLILNDANWTLSGTNAITSIAGPLAGGGTFSIDINFKLDSSLTANTYTNFVEIFGVEDESGNPITDIDSTPDMINGNDNITSPLYYTDEDDHDGAEFTIADTPAPCNNNNAGYFCE